MRLLLVSAIVLACVSGAEAQWWRRCGRGCQCEMCRTLRANGYSAGNSAYHWDLYRQIKSGQRSQRLAAYESRPLDVEFQSLAKVAIAEDEYTPRAAVIAMVRAARIQPGDIVVVPGSGDARLEIAVIKAGAVRAIGFEIKQSAVVEARRAVAAAGLEDQIEIWHVDVLLTKMDVADVILVNLFPQLLELLEAEMTKAARTVISYAHSTFRVSDPLLSVDGKTIFAWNSTLR